jgi:hypothetical protein
VRAFLFADRQLTPDNTEFGDALALAHRGRTRPLCLCTTDRVPMYVARLGSGFMLKRMPGTGAQHAPACPSRGPPIVPTVSATAATIRDEDHSSPLTVTFSLAKRQLPSVAPHDCQSEGSSSSNGDGLTLVGFLHYLWNEAELNRWQPAFAGRRSWATVRRRLLAASVDKSIGRRPLSDLLYIPEVFSVERRREIHERRLAAWAPCLRSRDRTWRLMLLIGELKQIKRTASGSRLVIKHVPDQAFRDEHDRRRGATAPEENLEFERSADRHWLVVATFSADITGTPFIEERAVVPTDRHWLLEDGVSSDRARDAAPGIRAALGSAARALS